MRRGSLGPGFLLGAVLALGGLAGLSLALVRSEQRAAEEIQGGEIRRLALWRLDSWFMAHLTSEAARSPLDYSDREAQPSMPWLVDYFEFDPASEEPTLCAGIDLEEAQVFVCEVEGSLPRWGGILEEPAPAILDGLDSNSLSDSVRQQNLSIREQQSRSKLAYESQWIANNFRDLPSASEPVVGPFVPMWGDPAATGGRQQLAFVRRVGELADGGLQGFLVDWPLLEEELLGETADLLPAASLTPTRDAESAAGKGLEGELLATLPVRLVPGQLELERPPLSAATRTTLALSWVGALLALGAVGFTLRASERYAEKRSRFASTVTHELRTPLTTFRMYSEMLARDMVPEAERGEYLETLRRESDRLARLVENVLAYSRLEEGRHEPRQEQLSLRGLVERCLPVLESHALEAGALLDWRLDGDAGGEELRVDPDGVCQVLFNLVDNACKYGKDAAGQATIELVAFAGEGEVALRVSDGGAGVPARERELIFGAFERGSRGGTEPNAGVGLGLALSAELASAMGGRLSIRNDAPGKGATFELLLPRG